MPNMKPNIHCLKMSLNNYDFLVHIVVLNSFFFWRCELFQLLLLHIAVKKHTSGVLGSVIFLQLLTLGSYEGGVCVCFLSTTSVNESSFRNKCQGVCEEHLKRYVFNKKTCLKVLSTGNPWAKIFFIALLWMALLAVSPLLALLECAFFSSVLKNSQALPRPSSFNS